MGMLPVQGDAGFHEGGQYVHLTEVNPAPFEPDPRNRKPFDKRMGTDESGSVSFVCPHSSVMNLGVRIEPDPSVQLIQSARVGPRMVRVQLGPSSTLSLPAPSRSVEAPLHACSRRAPHLEDPRRHLAHAASGQSLGARRAHGLGQDHAGAADAAGCGDRGRQDDRGVHRTWHQKLMYSADEKGAKDRLALAELSRSWV
jgi:hypothetical protein